MLKELGENPDALQFTDIFPDVSGVVVCGCNELAYHFVQYLESLHASVAVVGGYWEYFGYQSSDLDFDSGDEMIIYAEPILENNRNLFQRMIRSASPVLINDTCSHSGNVFFKGILDGHLNILLLQYGIFSNNLFSYCIRLSIEKAENILDVFKSMLETEMGEDVFQREFPFWNRFERSMERWLSFQEKVTSQELFLIFHIVINEMMGKKLLMRHRR